MQAESSPGGLEAGGHTRKGEGGKMVVACGSLLGSMGGDKTGGGMGG